MHIDKYVCDHCGKPLDEMEDYIEVNVEVWNEFEADLCANCIKELDRMALEFCKKEYEEKGR